MSTTAPDTITTVSDYLQQINLSGLAVNKMLITG